MVSASEKLQPRYDTFDLHPLLRAELSDLDLSQIERDYLADVLPPNSLAFNDQAMQGWLAGMKMIVAEEHPIPTILGMLMLGKIPQDYIPGAWVQFLRLDGSDLSDPIVDSMTIHGNVRTLIRRSEAKVAVHNHVNDPERDNEHFPAIALNQIIRNAIMHRSYEGTHAPVRILWFEDRFEVISPGGLFGTVNDTNIGQPDTVDYRNPNLAEAMRTLRLAQCSGVGIPTANSLLKEVGYPPLEFEDVGFLQVTIRKTRT